MLPQFCLIFNIEGMKLDRYCFHVGKPSEDQKKNVFVAENLKSFCTQNEVKTKNKIKRSSPKIEKLLSPKACEDECRKRHPNAYRHFVQRSVANILANASIDDFRYVRKKTRHIGASQIALHTLI